MNQLDKNKLLETSLIIDEMPPDEILAAQEDCSQNKEQVHQSLLHLFFSFDVVNSTVYKTTTYYWPVVMTALLEELRKRVSLSSDLCEAILWRVIGDEMIFVIKVKNEERLKKYVESIFELTQRMTILLRSGKFFTSIENQSLKKKDIDQLSIQSPLSLKTAAWIASINNKYENKYDCIKVSYDASSTNQNIIEYLGSDIDAGFRLKQYTQDRRVAISFELACLLKEEYHNLFIMDYVRLKGVWNESLYPLIWYYNKEIIKTLNEELLGDSTEVPFQRSFRYDETDHNSIVAHYFARGKQYSRSTKVDDFEKNNFALSRTMFDARGAIQKIIKDKNLQDKINYYTSLYQEEMIVLDGTPFESPLELHCAVICCDVKSRCVMITHRGKEHTTNPGKWEFGCARAKSNDVLKHTIEEYYLQTYDIDIELLCDKDREECQPKPLAIYEIGREDNIKKGVIFVGRVKKHGEYRGVPSHDEILWITEDQIDEYTPSMAVQDFHSTLKQVFKNWDIYFGG